MTSSRSSLSSRPARGGVSRVVFALVWMATALVVLVGAAGVAQAQQRPGQPERAAEVQGEVQGEAQAAQQGEAPASVGDRALNQSKASALVFWLFALAMVAGSVFVITRRNLITAVMGMVGTFFAIAAVFAMLYASFLAVIQVLVYAGAIMVLFVFVIMIMNKPETEPWSVTNLAGKIAIGVLLLYLVARLGAVLWAISPGPEALQAPEPVQILTAEGPKAEDFGSTRALGNTLFRDYLFPFEAVSLVLLIAVVGAIAVARPHERQPTELDSAEGGASK